MMREFLSPCLEKDKINNISVLGLAHVGDAAYELMVRTWLCELGPALPKSLHKRTVGMVSASAQAKAAGQIMGGLTEEELSFFMRGRNAHVRTLSKNTDRSEYQHATGFETLFGFLYLSGQRDRMYELFDIILKNRA